MDRVRRIAFVFGETPKKSANCPGIPRPLALITLPTGALQIRVPQEIGVSAEYLPLAGSQLSVAFGRGRDAGSESPGRQMGMAASQ
jgi:hypothetical protein